MTFQSDKARASSQNRNEQTWKPGTDARTDMALDRTALALARTHLAWIRTCLSLISIGFAVDKGLEALHRMRLLERKAMLHPSHIFGVLVAVFGTLMMAGATVDYLVQLRKLEGDYLGLRVRPLLPSIASVLVTLLGILVCVGMFYSPE